MNELQPWSFCVHGSYDIVGVYFIYGTQLIYFQKVCVSNSTYLYLRFKKK